MGKIILVYTFFFCAIFFPACNQNKPDMTATFEGEDLTQNAQILRDKETKKASIKIDIQGPWQLYYGYSTDSIDFSRPLLTGEGSGEFELNVADSLRSYFELVTDNGKAILTDKHLPMTGGYNFRDLGGVRTTEGRYVKWGKLFRADDLANLTPSDLNYLNYLPVRSIVDFRSQQEIKSAPDRYPKSVMNNFDLSIAPGNLTPDQIMADFTKIDFAGLMQEINVLLVSDSTAINRYREFFQILLDEDNVPVLYHCTAGKDRTGMATALILLGLGVDEETVINDYLLSKVYLADKYAPMVERYPQMAPLMTVEREYLQAGLDEIKADHGSVENYLKTVLGVDIKKLKSMYLY